MRLRVAYLEDTERLLRSQVENKLAILDVFKEFAQELYAPENVRCWHEFNRERFQEIDSMLADATNSSNSPANASTWARLDDFIQDVLNHFYCQFLPLDLNYTLDPIM